MDDSRRDIGAYFINSTLLIGDCNADDSQNILDILYIINNCILSEGILSDCECSDVNEDSIINVLDIVMLVLIILN